MPDLKPLWAARGVTDGAGMAPHARRCRCRLLSRARAGLPQRVPAYLACCAHTSDCLAAHTRGACQCIERLMQWMPCCRMPVAPRPPPGPASAP